MLFSSKVHYSGLQNFAQKPVFWRLKNMKYSKKHFFPLRESSRGVVYLDKCQHMQNEKNRSVKVFFQDRKT